MHSMKTLKTNEPGVIPVKKRRGKMWIRIKAKRSVDERIRLSQPNPAGFEDGRVIENYKILLRPNTSCDETSLALYSTERQIIDLKVRERAGLPRPSPEGSCTLFSYSSSSQQHAGWFYVRIADDLAHCLIEVLAEHGFDEVVSVSDQEHENDENARSMAWFLSSHDIGPFGLLAR